MEFIAKKLQYVQGLRKPLFFWDDTALEGKPKALAQAISNINKCADMTGLRLKWRKCHVHALPSILLQCKTLLPKMMAFHSNFNMEYLKASISENRFVKQWPEKKIKKLKKSMDLLSGMPHKHDATALLKSTAAVCRSVYLMRILPPRQNSAFI